MNLPADPLARWSALLKCGHEARTRGKPEPGRWITCPHDGQQRVVSVSAVRQVPEPGEIGVQGELWEAA